MDKRVFSKTYIVASCVRLMDNQDALICVVMFDTFSYCVIFLQNVNVWFLSVVANFLEPLSQRFVIFCHEDNVRVHIKSAFDSLT
jgi:hypothetical protein